MAETQRKLRAYNSSPDGHTLHKFFPLKWECVPLLSVFSVVPERPASCKLYP